MKIDYGSGPTIYGPGINISLSGNEIAKAIDLYLLSHNVIVRGPRTIKYNGELLNESGRV